MCASSVKLSLLFGCLAISVCIISFPVAVEASVLSLVCTEATHAAVGHPGSDYKPSKWTTVTFIVSDAENGIVTKTKYGPGVTEDYYHCRPNSGNDQVIDCVGVRTKTLIDGKQFGKDLTDVSMSLSLDFGSLRFVKSHYGAFFDHGDLMKKLGIPVDLAGMSIGDCQELGE